MYFKTDIPSVGFDLEDRTDGSGKAAPDIRNPSPEWKLGSAIRSQHCSELEKPHVNQKILCKKQVEKINFKKFFHFQPDPNLNELCNEFGND